MNTRKTLPTLGMLACCLAFSACATVEKALNGMPQVSAAEMHITSTSPYTDVAIDAVNLRQSETTATADSLVVRVSVPLLGTDTIQIKGYSRAKRSTKD